MIPSQGIVFCCLRGFRRSLCWASLGPEHHGKHAVTGWWITAAFDNSLHRSTIIYCEVLRECSSFASHIRRTLAGPASG